MAHTRRTTKKDSAPFARGLRRLMHRVGAGLPFLVLIVAIAFTMAAVGFASRHTPVTAASGTGGGANHPGTPVNPLNLQHTCGFQGLPACPTNEQEWIPLRSTNPGDIIAAARTSRLFNINAAGNGDTPSLSRLGIPQLVLAFRANLAVGSDLDYYLIPIQDTTGATLGVVMCQVNAGRTALSVVDIVQWAHSRPAGQVTSISAQSAVAAVQARQNVALVAGGAPQLIYFPGSAMAQETGKLIWVSGGAQPYDPVWMVPGADGQEHIVGSDGQVYDASQLPAALLSPSAG
jgi:hypothetical protein